MVNESSKWLNRTTNLIMDSQLKISKLLNLLLIKFFPLQGLDSRY
jgi:hypothetical protein